MWQLPDDQFVREFPTLPRVLPLKTQNMFPREDRAIFVEDGHAYFVDGVLVPRLVALQASAAATLHVAFRSVVRSLDLYVSTAAAELNIPRLDAAYEALERVCLQYMQVAVCSLDAASLPAWHHQLLQSSDCMSSVCTCCALSGRIP